MLKRSLIVLPIVMFLFSGCSSNAVTPDRNSQHFGNDVFTFQLAVVLSGNPYLTPDQVPTDVPIGSLINPSTHSKFASISLSAFDIYIDPSFWVDSSATIRELTNYEPSDWDDWLTSTIKPSPIIRLGSLFNQTGWLENMGMTIDPMGNYEPSDWDDWLTGNYEPSDWDDWLVTATLDDLAALN